VLPVGENKYVAARLCVSMGVCTVDRLFECDGELCWLISWERKGCVWPCGVCEREGSEVTVSWVVGYVLCGS
jgi:hypothetical protein